jgi:hypothetical protein
MSLGSGWKLRSFVPIMVSGASCGGRLMFATPRLLLQRSTDPMGLFQRAGKLRVVESRSAVLRDSNSVSTSRTTAASQRLPSGTCLFTIMAESEKKNGGGLWHTRTISESMS